jgi:Helix-turn-helix domain
MTDEASVLMMHEAAALLRIHQNTLKRIPPAELPYFRVGRRGDRRYLRSDILAYMAARAVLG